MASQQPPREEETVTRDAYELTFYPGFCSRAVVREANGAEHPLYVQTRAYRLPPGQTRPKTRHRLRLRGGRRNQDVTLEIHDPGLRVARIMIELYEEPRRDDARRADDEPVETLTVDNHPKICPPDCDDST